MAGNT